MSRTIVSRKGGYTISAEVNPSTRKLFNFQIKGLNVNSNVVYPYYTEAENVVNYHIKKQEEAKQQKLLALQKRDNNKRGE